MMKNKVINTPVGKISVGPNATPSEAPTKEINKMKTEFVKVAKSGNVPIEKLREDETKYVSS